MKLCWNLTNQRGLKWSRDHFNPNWLVKFWRSFNWSWKNVYRIGSRISSPGDPIFSNYFRRQLKLGTLKFQPIIAVLWPVTCSLIGWNFSVASIEAQKTFIGLGQGDCLSSASDYGLLFWIGAQNMSGKVTIEQRELLFSPSHARAVEK